jgi:hypothetical protein
MPISFQIFINRTAFNREIKGIFIVCYLIRQESRLKNRVNGSELLILCIHFTVCYYRFQQDEHIIISS